MGNSEGAAHVVGTWLAAETRVDDRAASQALAELVRLFPPPFPPAGFTRRVTRTAAREGLLFAPSKAALLRGRAWILGWVAGGIALLAGSVIFLGPLMVRLAVRLLNFSVQGFVWIVGRLEGGLDSWSLMVEIGRALGASLTTPRVGASLVIIELVGVAALYLLRRMLAQDRESKQ